MNKNTTIVVAVLAVALIVGSAYVLTNRSSEEFTDDQYLGTKLWVLGNANGDMVIDDSDKAAINDAIKEGASAKKKPMCDANRDGKIDSADAEFVQKMIDGTAKSVFYYNVDGEINEFKMYDKINVVALHRCVVRSATILANFDEDVKIVGMDSNPYKEAEFNVSSNYPDAENTGVIAEMDSEKFGTLESKYMKNPDEGLVILIGTVKNYLNNLEDWSSKYRYQVVRIPTWEHHPVQGVLTTAYLFAGVGNTNERNDSTCWNHALKYADWAFKYLDDIEKQSSKIADKDKLNVLGVYTATKNYSQIKKQHPRPPLRRLRELCGRWREQHRYQVRRRVQGRMDHGKPCRLLQGPRRPHPHERQLLQQRTIQRR